MQIVAIWRKNWLLILLFCGVLLFMAWGIFQAIGGDEDEAGTTSARQGSAETQRRLRSSERAHDEAELRSIVEREPGPQAPDKRAQTEAVIASHQAAFDAAPDAPDAPAYLRAIGNLQMQRLGDYEAAARNYELIVENYADWEQAHTVYGELITCYEMLDDTTSINRVCELMLERFPENSEAYLFALDKLGLWDGEFREIVEEETEAEAASEPPSDSSQNSGE